MPKERIKERKEDAEQAITVKVDSLLTAMDTIKSNHISDTAYEDMWEELYSRIFEIQGAGVEVQPPTPPPPEETPSAPPPPPQVEDAAEEEPLPPMPQPERKREVVLDDDLLE